MKQVAEELGVSYVLEGSVRKLGDRVRITAQLNDVLDRQPHLGGALRSRSCRRVRGPGRDHRGHRRGDRAANLCRGKFPRPAQAAGAPGRLGPPDAGAVPLLAGDPTGQRRRAGAAGEGDRHRSELRPGARAARDQSHFRRPHGLGGHGDRGADRRARGAGGDPGRQRGSLGASRAWAALICSRGGSTMRWPSSKRRCGSTRTSRWPRATTASTLAYCGRWEEADEAASRALRLSPRDPFSAIYYGVVSYAQFVGRKYEEAMRLARSAIRLHGEFVGGYRVLAAAAGMAGQVEVAAAALQRTAPRPAQYFAGVDRRARCRSSMTPTANTIWKASAAPAWTSLLGARPLQWRSWSCGARTSSVRIMIHERTWRSALRAPPKQEWTRVRGSSYLAR